MTSIENRLRDLHAPGVRVESHHTQLGYRLMRPAPVKAPLYRRPVFAGAALTLLLLAGLTVAHPGWAEELLSLILVSRTQVTMQDGRKAEVQTYQVNSTIHSGTTHLTVGSDGQVRATQNSAGDPAMEAMHTEAEAQIRSGQARLILEQNGMRFYKVTLHDGRVITYASGPGTSWSVSTEQ